MVSPVFDFFVQEKSLRPKIHGNEPAKRTSQSCGISELMAYNARKAVQDVPAAEPAVSQRGREQIEVDDST